MFESISAEKRKSRNVRDMYLNNYASIIQHSQQGRRDQLKTARGEI